MAMSFDSLPEDWTQLPMHTPGLAVDVVDLLLRESDRDRDSLLVVPCDGDGVPEPAMSIVVAEVPWRCTAAERRDTLTRLARLRLPAVVLAISCSFGIPSDVAERWRRSASSILADHGVDLIALCSASARGVHEVTEPVSDVA